MNKKVCIFCGANSGKSNHILNQTILLCDILIRSGYSLVYGGGGKGLMGKIANRFIQKGSPVIGVRPKRLIENEETHTNITELIEVNTMQERKSKMIELSDLFIALPGGIGTLDEIIETFTLNKIGFTDKQSGILNTGGFYNDLLNQLEKMTAYGFLTENEKYLLKVANNPKALVDSLNIAESEENVSIEIDKIAFIEIKNQKVLVSKSKGKSKYYIPGGKREPNESDESTLIREVEEELSVFIDQNTIEYFDTFKAQADGKPKGINVRMTCYEAKYKGELEPSNEIELIDWFDCTNMDLIAEVDKKIFTSLKKDKRIN